MNFFKKIGSFSLLILTLLLLFRPGEVRGNPCSANPIPGGGTITFSSNRNGYYELYVIDGSECNIYQLTDDQGVTHSPGWSPDGSQLVFSQNGILYVMNADGSNKHQLLSSAPSGNQHSPVWSPDGTRITFNIDVGRQDLFVVNADGSGLTLLASNSGRDNGDPSWTPDSNHIVYSNRTDPGNDVEISIMNADGSNKHYLMPDNSTSEGHPSVSPDGSKIAFTSGRDGGVWHIYVMDFDGMYGSNVQRLTTQGTTNTGPRWSPDSSRIVFYSDRDGNLEIYTMNADGNNQTRITNNSERDITPVWGGPALNQPPVGNSGGPYSGDEGVPILLDQATASDPDNDLVTYTWTVNSSRCTFSDSTLLNPLLTCDDNGFYEVTLTVNDGINDPVVTSPAMVTVNNVAPTIEAIVVPLEPVDIGNQNSFTVDVTFSDPAETQDEPYTCAFDLDYDGTTFVSDVEVSSIAYNSCSALLAYNEPGVYALMVVVTDKDGGVGSAIASDFIVVYDPDSGFVTGGGWIWSQVDWCQLNTLCANATGKANFGFVSKYRQGASAPTGNTEFNFSAGGFNFSSDDYEWLVVNQGGTNAQFKGSGKINGEMAANGTPYKFMIWAQDNGQGTNDAFRIKIWYEDNGNEIVVYDNGFYQPIGGGNIVIHQ